MTYQIPTLSYLKNECQLGKLTLYQLSYSRSIKRTSIRCSNLQRFNSLVSYIYDTLGVLLTLLSLPGTLFSISGWTPSGHFIDSILVFRCQLNFREEGWIVRNVVSPA